MFQNSKAIQERAYKIFFGTEKEPFLILIHAKKYPKEPFLTYTTVSLSTLIHANKYPKRLSRFEKQTAKHFLSRKKIQKFGYSWEII